MKGNPHKVISQFFSRNSAGQREWHNAFKVIKGKTYNQEDINQLHSCSDLTETAKVRRIQHHQTRIKTNAKRSSLGRKVKVIKKSKKKKKKKIGKFTSKCIWPEDLLTFYDS